METNIQAVEFGPLYEDVRSVGDVTQHIIDAWQDKAQWKYDDSQHPHEAQSLKLDISKAQSRLNWKPRWRLEDTLDSVVFWYKSRPERKECKRALS